MIKQAVCLVVVLTSFGCGDGEEGNAEPVPAAIPIDDYALVGAVQIVTDDQDVPHVRGDSDLDVLFASGYLQAEHALYDMELTRRAALGTRAEVLGAAERASDVQARVLGFSRWGEASMELLRETRPEDHNFVVAFAAGINRRVDEVLAGEAPLPEGFAAHGFLPERWDNSDPMSIGVRIQFGFSSTLAFDVLATLVSRVAKDAEALPIFAPAGDAHFMQDHSVQTKSKPGSGPSNSPAALPSGSAEFLAALNSVATNHGMGEGSNNWMVAGAFTDNGRPYFANDSHAALTSPNRMMVLHLDSMSQGGSFDAIGFAFLGVPAVHVGHNRAVVWGATTAFADATDIWDVAPDGDSVTIGTHTLTLETRVEVIRIKGADGEVTEEAVEIRDAPGLGVILPPEMLPVPKELFAKGELLLGWPGFAPTDELAQFFALDRSKTLADFAAAVDLQRTGMQNWGAASAKGIALRARGLVPDRGPAEGRARSNFVIDAEHPRAAWTGAMLPPANLPTLGDERDFIATANNDPWGHSTDNDPTNDDFYYGSYFAPGFRARFLSDRLTELTARGGITRAETEALQTDVQSPMATELLPMLAEAVDAIGEDPSLEAYVGQSELLQARDDLLAWDGRTERSSRSALVFRWYAAFLSRRTLEGTLSALFMAIDDAQAVTIQKLSLLVHRQKNQTILAGKGRQHHVGALADALAALESLDQDLGASATWGDVHRAVFRHSDNSTVSFASDGDDSALNVAQSHCWQDGSIGRYCDSTSGAVFRLVVGFDDDGVPRGTFATPENNAGDTQGWVDGQFMPLHFMRADVDAHITAERTLAP